MTNTGKTFKKSICIFLLFFVLFSTLFTPQNAGAQPATSVTATLKLDSAAFSDAVDVDIQWSAADLPVGGTYYVLIWVRQWAATATVYSAANCKLAATISPGATNSSGTFTFSYSPLSVSNQNTIEFALTVESTTISGPGCSGAPASLAATTTPLDSTFIDTTPPSFFTANPPSNKGAGDWKSNRVACNTFEMWGMASDNLSGAAVGYSGLQSWNQAATGIYIPPAEGTAPTLLSWPYTFPPTAIGPWTFKVNPTDAAGNGQSTITNYRTVGAPDSSEVANCKSFTDTMTGNQYEIYFRYLADLGIFAGNATDGTSGINSTLSRAEAATVFEKLNGWTSATGLPGSPPSAACTFNDVSSTDWFSGWVWQACADGFMAGEGSTTPPLYFNPSGLLSRGQAVTILNNINGKTFTHPGTYFASYTSAYRTILKNPTALWTSTTPYRSLAWTDVNNIDYYAVPVKRAYGVGVADATGATTFSPGAAITRGEFAKMLYRALSRVP